jgi:hypothetical protein
MLRKLLARAVLAALGHRVFKVDDDAICARIKRLDETFGLRGRHE